MTLQNITNDYLYYNNTDIIIGYTIIIYITKYDIIIIISY